MWGCHQHHIEVEVPKDAAVSAAASFASPQAFSDTSHPMLPAFPGKGVSLSQPPWGGSGTPNKAGGGNGTPSIRAGAGMLQH